MKSCALLMFWGVASFAFGGDRGVTIRWDEFGVPHVEAKDMEGLFFGYGYAQLASHGDLVLKLYGESRGRAAEYWGPRSEKPELFDGTDNLANDRWVQLNEAPERAAAWLTQQSPEFQRYFAAFADGMNAFADGHPDALTAESRKVLPVQPVDSLLHVHRIVHFAYLSSMRRVESAVKERAAEPEPRESNAWAIAPSRTRDGNTMLLMNPHLPFADWYTYYEAHLSAPGINLYGASQIGFPMLRFVFSDFLGFTQTVNGIDASDLYELTLSADGSGYVFDGETRAFESETKALLILQPDGSFDEEELLIRKSVHGPVVWDEDGLTLAIRTAALDRPYLIEQYWKMALARSFDEYKEQLDRLQVPTFNITYADRDGHIQYQYNGTLPKRASGDDKFWSGIVPGDTSETLWTEVHEYAELPRVEDPASGWVQNTNNPPWAGTYPDFLDPADYPPYVAGTDLSFRTLGSLRMLAEGDRFDFESVRALKHSTHLESADRVLPGLSEAVSASDSSLAKEAMVVLEAWDRSTEIRSRGALLYELFAKRFLAANFRSTENFAVAADWRKPFATPMGVKDAAAAVAMLEEAAEEALETFGELDAPWGEYRRFVLDDVDLPAAGADGNIGSFRVFRYVEKEKGSPTRKVSFGETFVALVEFSDPVRAEVLMSYGNSSNPESPHLTDQLPHLSESRLRKVWMQPEEVLEHTVRAETF